MIGKLPRTMRTPALGKAKNAGFCAVLCLVVWTLNPTASIAQGTDTSSASPEPADTGPIVRGLSWDIMGGGIPLSGSLIQAEAGFSGAPRLAYHHPVREDLSVGALVAFDYALHSPTATFSSLILAVPIRYKLFHNRSTTIGVRAEPGLIFGVKPFQFAFGLHLSANAGFTFDNRFIIGGGIDLPLAFIVPGSDRRRAVRAPLLFGPFAEYHLSPPLALTLDAKAGPAFQTTLRIRFGFKLLIGVAYRL